MKDKRNGRKRLIALMFALVFAGILTACSGSGNETKESSSEQTLNTSNSEEDNRSSEEDHQSSEDSVSGTENNSTESQPQESSEVTQVADVDEFSSLLTGTEGAKLRLEKNTYYFGDRFAIWMEKGVNVPEDLPQMIEEIMTDEEEILGIQYANGKYAENGDGLEYYFGNGFQGLAYPKDKVNILLQTYKDDGAIECADTNEILLFDEDFDPELQSGETVYHELSHVLRLRQSPNLGQVLEEGIASYAQWKIALKRNTPCWNMIQFVNSGSFKSGYDEDAILKDPEQAFREANLAPRSAGQIEYQYGIRFVTFLMETYGPDVIQKLGESAAKRSFSEEDNDAIIEVIREATSEDVFEQFGNWVPNGWKKCSDDIIESLKPYGL